MHLNVSAPRFARLALVALLTSSAGSAAALAQDAPQTSPVAPQATPRGYEDPEGIPVRTRPADLEPVWARPAVDTLATVRRRGVLRVGVVPVEPFVMRNASGELIGFSIDLGRQLADDIGVGVEFVPTAWSQVIADLVNQHFDVIAAGLWITPARALLVNFSNPTSIGAVHLVANRALTASMTSRQDFDRPDVKLVVYAGSSQEGLAARSFPKASLIKIEGDADSLAPVLEGKAHGALVTTPTPRVLVEGAPALTLPFDEPLQVTTTALAVRKGDADFLNFLDSWLAFQRENGWLGERQHFWFRTTEWLKGL